MIEVIPRKATDYQSQYTQKQSLHIYVYKPSVRLSVIKGPSSCVPYMISIVYNAVDIVVTNTQPYYWKNNTFI